MKLIAKLFRISIILHGSGVCGFGHWRSTARNAHRVDRRGIISFEKADPRDVGSRRGYYSRPSAAIEKGGGFFIPGLQGDKLQLGVSCFIIFLLIANRFPGYDAEPTQLVSESVAALVSFGVLLQPVFTQSSTESQTPPGDFSKFSYGDGELRSKTRVLSAADSLVELTDSNVALLIRKNRVLACVGEYERSHFILKDGKTGNLEVYIDEVTGSRGGLRLLRRSASENNNLFSALPSTCGTVAILSLTLEEHFWLIGTPAQGWTEGQLNWLQSVGKFTAECLVE